MNRLIFWIVTRTREVARTFFASWFYRRGRNDLLKALPFYEQVSDQVSEEITSFVGGATSLPLFRAQVGFLKERSVQNLEKLPIRALVRVTHGETARKIHPVLHECSHGTIGIVVESRTIVEQMLPKETLFSQLLSCYAHFGKCLPEIGLTYPGRAREILVCPSSLPHLCEFFLLADEWVAERILQTLFEALSEAERAVLPPPLRWEDVSRLTQAGGVLLPFLEILPDGFPARSDAQDYLAAEILRFSDRGFALSRTLVLIGASPLDVVFEEMREVGFEEFFLDRRFSGERKNEGNFQFVPVDSCSAPNIPRLFARLQGYSIGALHF